ncbi:hypothetical protein HX088_11600 [Empedobacter sp. 225-1]|uniref:hypothetical protein n=1 Tax=Empedobacter sp. 225-1 TaxID=2746725 RepID=UPI0025768762|nr:hypothetical protein [Empedobacter sp. 225-1]MDM1523911.1 hypothetical protein [Empedobacter sp. 225-1]
MKEYKPIRYFVENNLIEISGRQLKRNALKAFNSGCNYVIQSLTKNNKIQYEILVDEIVRIGERKRKPKESKKPVKIIKEFESKTSRNYITVVTINFKDTSDVLFYDDLVLKFFEYSKTEDMYYSIEIDDDGYTHAHLASTGDINSTYNYLNQIINIELQLNQKIAISMNGEKSFAPVEISPMRDHQCFLEYISKESYIIYLNVVAQKWS